MNFRMIGVRIDNLAKIEVLERIKGFFVDGAQHIICTPNPEMLVAARKDEFFAEILNDSDLNVCDGKGIQLLSRGKVHRIPGVDLMQEICMMAEENDKKIYLLGSGDSDVVKKCAENLQRQHSRLQVVGLHPGIRITSLDDKEIAYSETENHALLERIIMAAPGILFVAFGHEKQEKWIYENLKHLPSVKVAMGVGGAFDFISGKTKRAPQLIQRVGMEWLWRFIHQPWRVKRIWNATALFLWYLLLDRKQDLKKTP